MRQYKSVEYNKKRLSNNQVFIIVQLQTWFREKRERYQVVDATRQPGINNESRNINNGHGHSSGSDNDNTRDIRAVIKAEIKEQIKKEEEAYKMSIIITEIDPWLQYTSQEEVLASSKHDLVKTTKFIAITTTTEPELKRLLQS